MIWKIAAALFIVLLVGVLVVCPYVFKLWYFAPEERFFVDDANFVAFGEQIPLTETDLPFPTLDAETLDNLPDAEKTFQKCTLSPNPTVTADALVQCLGTVKGKLPVVANLPHSLLTRKSKVKKCITKITNINQFNGYVFMKKNMPTPQPTPIVCDDAHPIHQCVPKENDCCASYGRYQLADQTTEDKTFFCAPVQPLGKD